MKISSYRGVINFNRCKTLRYTFYKLLWWKSTSWRNGSMGIYDPYLLFWFGMPEMCFTMCAPLPSFFLTLDRICVVKTELGKLRPSKLAITKNKNTDFNAFSALNCRHFVDLHSFPAVTIFMDFDRVTVEPFNRFISWKQLRF